LQSSFNLKRSHGGRATKEKGNKAEKLGAWSSGDQLMVQMWAAMARQLVLFLCREWSGRVRSNKVLRGLATKLQPHLIALAK